MPREFVYDYYDVHIPRDAIPDDVECEFENQDIFNMAYETAQQRTRVCAMPCTWTFERRDDPDSADFHVRVCRKRCKGESVRAHFHMLVGVPGCIPGINHVCRSRSEAEGLALCEARKFRNDWDCDNDRGYYIVSGNKHNGYDVSRWSYDGLGAAEEVSLTIRVTECFEEDCLEEMED